MESNIEDSCLKLIDIKENLKEVSINLKSKDINAQNEISDQMSRMKRKNTILKRKQTFRSIKDIEAEKIINDLEDKLEKRGRRTLCKRPLFLDSLASEGLITEENQHLLVPPQPKAVVLVTESSESNEKRRNTTYI